jgi:hypothetical protein
LLSRIKHEKEAGKEIGIVEGNGKAADDGGAWRRDPTPLIFLEKPLTGIRAGVSMRPLLKEKSL